VMLVDEIHKKAFLRKLEEQNFPESVRMILILNPKESRGPLTLPPSFLHVTLTTPYRSTIAITSLSHFIAEKTGHVVPEGNFGSDVVGIKPIFFDLTEGLTIPSESELKRHMKTISSNMEKALEHCCKHLGDNATILHGLTWSEYVLRVTLKKQSKRFGGLWEVKNFYGWEADKVVAVVSWYRPDHSIAELISRARTHLAVILVGGGEHQYFQQAKDKGLVDFVPLSSIGTDTALSMFCYKS